METINGCTVFAPSEDAAYLRFGSSEIGGAYIAEILGSRAGEPGPPLHLHPNTDEAFYVGAGEATFLLGDTELPVTAGVSCSFPAASLIRSGTLATVWPVAFSSSRRATPSTNSSRLTPDSSDGYLTRGRESPQKADFRSVTGRANGHI